MLTNKFFYINKNVFYFVINSTLQDLQLSFSLIPHHIKI